MENKSCLYIWDHFSPDSVACVIGSVEDLEKISTMTNENYTWGSVCDEIQAVEWNDEVFYDGGTQCKTMEELKALVIEDLITESKEQEEDDIYIEHDMLCGGGFTLDRDTPENMYNEMISIIENSQVDGDSSYARALINTEKQTVECCSETSEIGFWTAQEYIDYYNENYTNEDYTEED